MFGIYLPISSDATMFPRTFIQSCGTIQNSSLTLPVLYTGTATPAFLPDVSFFCLFT